MSVMSRRFFCRRSLEFTYHLVDGAVGILLRVDNDRDEYDNTLNNKLPEGVDVHKVQSVGDKAYDHCAEDRTADTSLTA